MLQQNTGKQAAVVNIVEAARKDHGDSLAAVMNNASVWKPLVREVTGVVRVMPLWKLQTIGQERLDFLYANTGAGKTITLHPGVAYCFRKFHALIGDLVRGAWVRYVRQQNLKTVGEITDLNEFLFGSERAPLAVVRPVLLDLQRGRCFYCDGTLQPANTHVDHFVAWARYPVDLGHNFVLADSRCNGAKRDRLAAFDHLAAWVERNARFGGQIGKALEERGIVSQLAASNRVAQWAYGQTEAAHGLTWLKADEMVPLAPGWRGAVGGRVIRCRLPPVLSCSVRIHRRFIVLWLESTGAWLLNAKGQCFTSAQDHSVARSAHCCFGNRRRHIPNGRVMVRCPAFSPAWKTSPGWEDQVEFGLHR